MRTRSRAAPRHAPRASRAPPLTAGAESRSAARPLAGGRKARRGGEGGRGGRVPHCVAGEVSEEPHDERLLGSE